VQFGQRVDESQVGIPAGNRTRGGVDALTEMIERDVEALP
jgi:hypothetical protein